MEHQNAVHRNPEILEGTPVFVGTRVPFQTLIDYLEEGQSLAEFLADFPTVSRDQAIAALTEICGPDGSAREAIHLPGLVGCGEAEADLSTTYKSRLREGLGRKQGHR